MDKERGSLCPSIVQFPDNCILEAQIDNGTEFILAEKTSRAPYAC